MNEKMDHQPVSILIRAIAITTLVFTNFFSIFPGRHANAETILLNIRDDATGGDCETIGTWDAANKACTLTSDFYGIIGIADNNITLDGAGHILSGDVEYNDYNLIINGFSNVTVKNVVFQGGYYGIFMIYGTNVTIAHNQFSTLNSSGIYVMYSSNNILTENEMVATNITLFYSSGGNIVSNNNLIQGQIKLDNSTDNTIIGNTLSGSPALIELWYSSGANLVTENAISDSTAGVNVIHSPGATVSNNHFSNTGYYGIQVDSSPSTSFIGNTFTGSIRRALVLSYSGSCILRDNQMYSDQYNFSVIGDQDEHFIQDIDTSNTIFGKPIIYLIDAADQTFDSSSNASTFYCIRCNNMVVKDVTLNNNHGVFFWKVQNSTVENITSEVPWAGSEGIQGVALYYSDHNSILGNRVAGHTAGIYLYSSSENIVRGNDTDCNVTNIYLELSNDNTFEENGGSAACPAGFSLYSSSNNVITRNTIMGAYANILLSESSDNLIYNNLIFNTGVKVIGGSGNLFNLPMPVGGNYWEVFDIPDEGCYDTDPTDGVCDTPYIFDGGQDEFPWTQPGDWFNHPPQIVSITGPLDPVLLGTQVAMLAFFTDPDAGDSISATWAWGDGASSAGVVDEIAKTVSGSHAYLSSGVYEVQLDLVDAAGKTASATYLYVVVYDLAGGFITGGGWINSPAGAYLPDPTITGTANFGFIAKYKKDSTVPEGHLEFHLEEAELKFRSTSLNWLVVSANASGPYAILNGRGLLDGSEQVYTFTLWITDGSPDTLALRIWYVDAEGTHILYDSAPQAPIGGGSLVVHKVK